LVIDEVATTFSNEYFPSFSTKALHKKEKGAANIAAKKFLQETVKPSSNSLSVN
jgi:hypothetical protein